MLKKIYSFIVMFLLAVLPSFGISSLDDLVPDLSDKDRASLLAGKLLASDTTVAGKVLYAPTWLPADTEEKTKGKESSEIGEDEEREEFTVENLALIPMPEELKDKTLNMQIITLINTLRSVSTQEGITYISFRRGNTPHPLITKSYHVEEYGSRNKIDDPVIYTLPGKLTDIVFQKDTSFSNNYYEYSYSIFEENIYLVVKNLSNLAVFGLIPVIPKETLNITFGISIVEEGILCYAQARIYDRKPKISFLGFSVHLPSAFQRRITALQEWLAAQLL